MLVDETVNATIAPVNIDDFYVVHANAHEGALRKTVKQIGVTPLGQLHE